jgi:hypothetical protein
MKRSKLLPTTLSIAAALAAPAESPAIGRTIRFSRYCRALVLAALVAFLFVSTGLQAQLVNPSPPGFSETRTTQPVITCTAGRAGFIGDAGRRTTTVEMVVARGLAHVALGGAIFALAASFRFLGDNVGSFFDPLIPKKSAVLRTLPPLDDDFSPFTFDRRPSQRRSRKPRNSQRAAVRRERLRTAARRKGARITCHIDRNDGRKRPTGFGRKFKQKKVRRAFFLWLPSFAR